MVLIFSLTVQEWKLKVGAKVAPRLELCSAAGSEKEHLPVKQYLMRFFSLRQIEPSSRLASQEGDPHVQAAVQRARALWPRCAAAAGPLRRRRLLVEPRQVRGRLRKRGHGPAGAEGVGGDGGLLSICEGGGGQLEEPRHGRAGHDEGRSGKIT